MGRDRTGRNSPLHATPRARSCWPACRSAKSSASRRSASRPTHRTRSSAWTCCSRSWLASASVALPPPSRARPAVNAIAVPVFDSAPRRGRPRDPRVGQQNHAERVPELVDRAAKRRRNHRSDGGVVASICASRPAWRAHHSRPQQPLGPPPRGCSPFSEVAPPGYPIDVDPFDLQVPWSSQPLHLGAALRVAAEVVAILVVVRSSSAWPRLCPWHRSRAAQPREPGARLRSSAPSTQEASGHHRGPRGHVIRFFVVVIAAS